MRLPLPTILAAALLASASCERPGRTRTDLRTTIDSIGPVVYIQHTGAAPTSELIPLLSLGVLQAQDAASPGEEFGRIESIIADQAGQIFVADGIAMEVRVFSEDGRFLRTLAQEGAGPGEIAGLHGIAWLSRDTILVMDYGNARLMILDPSGQHLGQWPWLRLTGSARFLFNGGPRETYAHSFRVSGTGDARATWVRYGPGGPTDSLDIPQNEPRPGSGMICRGNGIGFFTNPFGDRPITVPAPAGERIVAWSSRYRIAFIDRAGDTTRIVSRDVESVSLPDTAWARVRKDYEEFRLSWRGTDCNGEVQHPTHRPVLRDIFFDHDGRMLVEHLTPTGNAFDLFTLEGRLLTTFPSLPDRDKSVVPFLRDDRLYLVIKTALDIQQVRVFRLSHGDIEPVAPDSPSAHAR